jgi:hypothetical protein
MEYDDRPNPSLEVEIVPGGDRPVVRYSPPRYDVDVRRRRRRIVAGAVGVVALAGAAMYVPGVDNLVHEIGRVQGANEHLATSALVAYEMAKPVLAGPGKRPADEEGLKTAMGLADQCVRDFRRAAMQLQEKLQRQGEPEPPLGPVSGKVKRQVLSNGALNDVATCLWLKGRCAEYLGQIGEARLAYEEASKLTYGRCWTPKGFWSHGELWSPAEQAMNDLENLAEAGAGGPSRPAKGGGE